ncbi:kdo(2)-lipid IV(A) palmitoleoyltransferase, partial [Proteus mirabilis]|nr:kdo(2)-lipid IV(A) palmitoleoyltransferase [Proteus mirabilis]MCD4627210.1 kdo(2)-lipid IV(A) palmitoleoyltransferase [Proteus mirabilis]
LIEIEIMRAPEQYLWAHRRFKTRPKGEASFY